jgi:hypothetical protein
MAADVLWLTGQVGKARRRPQGCAADGAPGLGRQLKTRLYSLRRTPLRCAAVPITAPHPTMSAWNTVQVWDTARLPRRYAGEFAALQAEPHKFTSDIVFRNLHVTLSSNPLKKTVSSVVPSSTAWRVVHPNQVTRRSAREPSAVMSDRQ